MSPLYHTKEDMVVPISSIWSVKLKMHALEPTPHTITERMRVSTWAGLSLFLGVSIGVIMGQHPCKRQWHLGEGQPSGAAARSAAPPPSS